MQETDVAALTAQVLWAAFALAVAFGAIAQRSHFCTMGAVADVVNMGSWARARMWVLAMGTAAIGFGAMAAAGWIDPARTIYTAPRMAWLSYLVGGLMFGFGMVLASGCGSKTLVRIGGGSLKSLLVFFVMGFAAFATLKGITAVVRVATVDTVFVTWPLGQDLPALLSGPLATSRRVLAGVLGGTFGVALFAWVLARREGRSAEVLLGGIGIGLVVSAMWWVSGHLGFVAEHPDTLEPTFLASSSRGMEAMSFVAPMAYTLDWLILFSDKSKLLSLGIVSAAGVVAGSALVALASRSFRWEGFGGTEDTANHIVGALLMGVGGITALGCTIGQGLSGISTLALGSFIALAAIVAGAVLALRYQLWRIS
ncbi:MAG TPA: YeeE/YedE family protein [Ideonella sp.]|nr:YeeE/YedE family protein [Ideonella sp.]